MSGTIQIKALLFAFAWLCCGMMAEAGERGTGAATASGQTGVASWYAGERNGRTASGERFRADGLTAAHRSLRFGTLVRVTNLRNNRNVVVRITDRGPFTKGRILDLSRRAATEIGMMGSGTARVRMEVLASEELAMASASGS
jgi:rare lipoprotein A